MSIVPLYKVTLCGMGQDQEAVLAGMLELGSLHLIPISQKRRSAKNTLSLRAEDTYKALHYLLQVSPRRRQIVNDSGFDISQVTDAVLINQKRRREVGDQLEYLQHQLKQLAPWGSFSLPDADTLQGYQLWLYRIENRHKEMLDTLSWPWQAVGQDSQSMHIVVLAPEKPSQEMLPVRPLSMPLSSIKEMEAETESLAQELDALDWERQALSRWIYLISSNLAQAEDQAALKYAEAQVIARQGVFILQGWLPCDQLKKIKKLGEKWGLAITAEVPSIKDNPPTLLRNPAVFEGGQDLVGFYETPCYHCWDPSVLVFFSFAIFFAMILADAGYAMLLTGVMVLYWNKLGKSEKGLRFRSMFQAILIASMIYGVMVGSYFGLMPSPGHPLAYLKIIDLNDYDAMIQLSVMIGCLHVGLANTMVAWQSNGLFNKIQPLGWISITVGGLIWWLSQGQVSDTLSNVGGVLMIMGVLAVTLYGSQRPVNDLKSGLMRGFDGFIVLTGATKLFGDILSYLRLFALGLASGSLAMTFNDIAGQIQQTMPGVGLLLSLLVLFLGHSVNLGLGLISGFVHGLRLNFIEFFNWAITEEGYPFQAFAKKEIKP
ncbi:MAG: V-type ATP synthase subunit I [Magnetococcales bacterium]|nr:V-type ATP synthase subunit I [Magnetococcales bacterium]